MTRFDPTQAYYGIPAAGTDVTVVFSLPGDTRLHVWYPDGQQRAVGGLLADAVQAGKLMQALADVHACAPESTAQAS